MSPGPSEFPASNDPSLLVFDGDCRFCRKSVARLHRWAGRRFPAKPSQEIEPGFAGISCADAEGALQYIDRTGARHQAAAAVFRCMEEQGISRLPWALYRQVPLFARICEFAYRHVASNRAAISRVEFALAGPSLEPPTYDMAMGLFLRGLGLVFAVAFVSLGVQLPGLIGSGGMLPAEELVARVGQAGVGWAQFPSVFRLGASDPVLQAGWLAGALAGLLAAAGVLQAPALLLAWMLYLSFCSIGGPFLSFQWDALLLEAGLLGVLAASWRPWVRGPGQSHPAVARWLLWWLLFRLMFASGVVKLASGDPSWAGLTALGHHFETQPLPLAAAWWAHHLPDLAHMSMTVGMFALELVLPFAIFLPRRCRLAAAAGLTALQAGIVLTGNYGFFNLLSLLLVLLLVDDHTLRRPAALARLPAWRCGLCVTVALPLVLLSTTALLGQLRLLPPGGRPRPLAEAIAPFRAVNSYGLFAVMTRERREITLEGSADGVEWKPYVFRWKPGDPLRAPGFAGPHMPRLDWQMWFAALGTVRQNPWFIAFGHRLLTGSPEVAALLESNPFPETPPRYIRARIQRYRFSSPEEKSATGVWWVTGPATTYLPPVSLENFRNAF